MSIENFNDLLAGKTAWPQKMGKQAAYAYTACVNSEKTCASFELY